MLLSKSSKQIFRFDTNIRLETNEYSFNNFERIFGIFVPALNIITLYSLTCQSDIYNLCLVVPDLKKSRELMLLWKACCGDKVSVTLI